MAAAIRMAGRGAEWAVRGCGERRWDVWQSVRRQAKSRFRPLAATRLSQRQVKPPRRARSRQVFSMERRRTRSQSRGEAGADATEGALMALSRRRGATSAKRGVSEDRSKTRAVKQPGRSEAPVRGRRIGRKEAATPCDAPKPMVRPPRIASSSNCCMLAARVMARAPAPPVLSVRGGNGRQDGSHPPTMDPRSLRPAQRPTRPGQRPRARQTTRARTLPTLRHLQHPRRQLQRGVGRQG